MDNFFIRTFIKNPLGLTILGIFVTFALGLDMLKKQNTPVFLIIGLIIVAVGVLWIIKNIRKDISNSAPHVKNYYKILDALKNNGYKVEEFERKTSFVNQILRNVCYRASVFSNEKIVGEVFFVLPPPAGIYSQFRRIEEDVYGKEFTYDYNKKHGKNPDTPASYWPEQSLVGAFVKDPVNNISDANNWLSIIKENLK